MYWVEILGSYIGIRYRYLYGKDKSFQILCTNKAVAPNLVFIIHWNKEANPYFLLCSWNVFTLKKNLLYKYVCILKSSWSCARLIDYRELNFVRKKCTGIAFLCDVFFASSPPFLHLLIYEKWKTCGSLVYQINAAIICYAKLVLHLCMKNYKKKNRDVLTLDSVAEHSRPLNTFSANFQELLFEYVCNALDFCSSLKSFFFTMFLKLIFQIMFDNTQLPCINSAKKIFFSEILLSQIL